MENTNRVINLTTFEPSNLITEIAMKNLDISQLEISRKPEETGEEYISQRDENLHHTNSQLEESLREKISQLEQSLKSERRRRINLSQLVESLKEKVSVSEEILRE